MNVDTEYGTVIPNDSDGALIKKILKCPFEKEHLTSTIKSFMFSIHVYESICAVIIVATIITLKKKITSYLEQGRKLTVKYSNQTWRYRSIGQSGEQNVWVCSYYSIK